MNGSFGSNYNPTGTSKPMQERSAVSVALDNLIRRRLRVSDPNNAHEVAMALQGVYVADRDAMAREAAGLPSGPIPIQPTEATPQSSSNAEVQQSIADVDRDLIALQTNALLKDIEPELKGWSYAIRNAISDGLNSARFALDPRQRERAFGARRILSDYARIARFVGALTQTLNLSYRRLAQSLDEVAALMLVLAGEALANIGFSGGRFLLQVPASELQERRDAVLYSLRNLTGTTPQAYGPNDWPRGLVAYRQLMDRLETSGQADLKALFQESYISRLMDDIIDRAASTNVEGLRALGSTAQLGVEGFRRLIIVGQRVVTPEAPTLAAFLNALQLFVDPFDDKNFSRGNRLLFISRPPIVFYGLYGVSGPDDGTDRLIDLIGKRGRLAELLDCYLDCGCTGDRVRCQILLDKILYDIDRSIDLYSLGTDPEGDGEPERRAAAYGFMVNELLAQADQFCCFDPPASCNETSPPSTKSIERELKRELKKIRDILWYRDDFSIPNEVTDIFGNPYTVRGFRDASFDELGDDVRKFNEDIDAIEAGSGSAFVNPPPTIQGNEVRIPDGFEELQNLIKFMEQELCIQLDSEQQWENLLHTMAPSCIRFTGGVLEPTKRLLKDAISRITIEPCQPATVSIPPHFETSLDSIADDISRTGEGRPTKP
jgi:hypothetical protein